MKNTIINILYLVFVIIITLMITTLALTRRVNRYNTNARTMTFTVDKDEILITNAVTGTIKSIHVQPGQHVKVGDLLVELTDESLLARLSTLEQYAGSNLSALTQAELLRSETAQFTIISPRNGIVYEVVNSAGANVPVNSKLLTLYADDGVRLNTFVTQGELELIQRVHRLDVFSPRLEQSFSAHYVSVGKVIYDQESQSNRYEVIFQFDNPDEGAAFLEGETLEVIGITEQSARRPADYIVDTWNKLIISN